MQFIYDLILGFVNWLLELLLALLELLGVIVIDMVCYVLDGLGEFLIWAVSSVDLTSLADKAAQMWSNVPHSALALAFDLGAFQALSIIGTALMVRLALQLVPFTRLGS